MSPAARECGAVVLCSSRCWRDTFGTRAPAWIAYQLRRHHMQSEPGKQARSCARMALVYKDSAQRAPTTAQRRECMRLAVQWAQKAEAIDPRAATRLLAARRR